MLNRLIDLIKRPKKQLMYTVVGKAYNVVDTLNNRLHHFDFDKNVEAVDLLENPNFSSKNAVHYQAHGTFYLKLLLKDALKIDQNFEYFIDIGCGKGKVCIKAAKFLKIKKIIGVDFSKKLIEIANQNLKKTNFSHIELINADAIAWKLPNSPAIIFLYNPFNEIILEQFIRNNIEILKNNNSLIIYSYAVHKAVFEKFGFVDYAPTNAFFSCILKAKPNNPILTN